MKRHRIAIAVWMLTSTACGVEPLARLEDSAVSAPSVAPRDAGDCRPDCAAPPPAPEPPSVAPADPCVEGLYTGSFEGVGGYLVPAIPIAALELPGGPPPLSINLVKMRIGTEFSVVGDGEMHGTANGAFPFEARIRGDLNCSTLRFTATTEGSVQVVIDGIDNAFTGTLDARYDPSVPALVDGTWTVTGSNADGGLDLGLTGSGTWHAEL